jgi:hypothetical protein
MRKSIILGFILAAMLMIMSAQRVEANVWGLSGVGYNPDTREVFGLSATWVDYDLAWYYDPEVLGELYWQYENEVPLDSGYGIGLSLPDYGILIPAVVNLYSVKYLPGTLYTTYSTHFVRSYYYYSSCSGFSSGCYFDPFGFSNYFGGFFGSNSGWPGFGFNPFNFVPGRRFTLGTTHVSILTPPGFFCLPAGVQSFAVTAPACASPTPTPMPTPVSFTTNISPANIRPAGVTGNNHTAMVTVQTSPAVANQHVTLAITLSNTSGGHATGHPGARPTGRLRPTSGNTDASGRFQSTYDAPYFGTLVTITANINGMGVGANAVVAVPGLQNLPAGNNYSLIGANAAHPSNHWGTANANAGLQQIATDYANEYYSAQNPQPENRKLNYNDQSLELGGKFDLAHGWSPTGEHVEHREGINADVRCCSDPGLVPHTAGDDRWVRLNEFFFNRGSTRTLDETSTAQPHWHLRFEFGQAQAAVQRNAASFIEETFWAALDHEASDDDWQDRMSTFDGAHQQGQIQTLDAAKALTSSLFYSTEYSGRNQTDQAFVTDLYASFLLREPDQGGYNFWLGVLQNDNANGLQGRAHLIQAFVECTEFADIVYALTDTPPPAPVCSPIEEQGCYNNGGTWDPDNCFCTYEPDPCANRPWLCDQY